MPKLKSGGGGVTAFPAPIGEPPAVQFFAPDRLGVDHAYQRQLESRASQKLVFAIAQSWDWRLCVPLLVSERADGLFILDGQHRWAAAKLRGDIPFLPCALGRFGSVAEEALLFVAANRKRVQVNRIDLFRAALAAGHEDECQVERLVRGAGLSIATHTNPVNYAAGELGCTGTLLKLYRDNGPKLTGAALYLLAEAFAGEVLSTAAVMLKTLVMLLKRPELAGQGDALLAVLRTKTCSGWAEHPRVRMAIGALREQELRDVILERLAASAGTIAERVPARAAPRRAIGEQSFEEQLAAVERGEVGIARKVTIPGRALPDQTLGGVSTGML